MWCTLKVCGCVLLSARLHVCEHVRRGGGCGCHGNEGCVWRTAASRRQPQKDLSFFFLFPLPLFQYRNDLQTRRLIALLFLLPDASNASPHNTLIRRRKHTHFQDGNHHLHTLYRGIPAVWGTGKVSWNGYISFKPVWHVWAAHSAPRWYFQSNAKYFVSHISQC